MYSYRAISKSKHEPGIKSHNYRRRLQAKRKAERQAKRRARLQAAGKKHRS